MGRSYLETDDLTETSVLWPAVSYDDDGARVTIGPPVEIKSRWKLGTKLSSGNEDRNVTSNAEIKVDREIPQGSILWRGKHLDLPTPIKDLYQVVGYSEVQDDKGRNKRRAVAASSYKAALPPSV